MKIITSAQIISVLKWRKSLNKIPWIRKVITPSSKETIRENFVQTELNFTTSNKRKEM